MSRILSSSTTAFHSGLLLTLIALLTVFQVSSKSVSAASETQKGFASPSDAGEALHKAAKSGDQAALLAIFGPEVKEFLFSEDPAKDQTALKDFVSAYEAMNRWVNIEAGGQMLYVGVENFPFPIPLQQNSSGMWFFNPAAGADEILARRIGRDELVAIATIGAIANAEQQYFSQIRKGEKVKQYARKFVSDQDTQNGLYWPAADGQPPSPLGQMGDFAKVTGYTKSGEKPQPFSGYNFRILTKQGNTAKGGAKDYIANGNMTGGFAILAYPSEYGNTGLMSFIVGEDGVIYEKNLGERTAESAAAMMDYNPGDGWQPVAD